MKRTLKLMTITLCTALTMIACGGAPDTEEPIDPIVPPTEPALGLGAITSTSHLLFIANLDQGDLTQYQLYGVDTENGGLPVLLSDPSPVANGDGVSLGFFSPDNEWVAYGADADEAGQVELYVVRPSDLSSRQKISGTMAADSFGLKPLLEGRYPANPDSVRWSPSGDQIAYVADALTPGLYELFLVDLSGGTASTPVKVNMDLGVSSSLFTPMAMRKSVKKFAFSKDGDRLAFLADPEATGFPELYMVEIGGTAGDPIVSDPAKLNYDRPNDQVVYDFEWSPAFGDLIAYTSEKLNCEDTPAVCLWPQEDDSVFDEQQINLYVRDVSDASSLGLFENVTSPSRGMVFGGDVTVLPPRLSGAAFGFAWHPSDDAIAFAADRDTQGVPALYTKSDLLDALAMTTLPPLADAWTPTLATSPVTLTPSTPAGRSFEWSPDGEKLLYQMTTENPVTFDDTTELYVNFLDGSGSIKVHEDFIESSAGDDRDVLSFSWSPDGESIAYLADQYEDSRFEVMSVALDNLGTSNNLSAFASLILSTTFQWSNDSEHVAIRGMSGAAFGIMNLFGVDKDLTETQELSRNTNTPGAITDGTARRLFFWPN